MEITDGMLNTFFEGLRYYIDVSREARKILSRSVASSFNVFDYLNPDENLLSQIIADLLNPNGSHGQDNIFISAFLAKLHKVGCKLPKNWHSFTEANVVNEASTSFISNTARRIDIRIELPGPFGIGIENKPWAEEQEAQLADYRKELERRYKGNFVLVFLCQRGRLPISIKDTELSELKENGMAAVLNYSDEFLSWLQDCIKLTEADKVRHFLKDFLRYVETKLSGNIQKEDQNHVQP